jgi:hypothetical protein
VKPIAKSSKLANIGYDIRGPVLDKARQMEDEGPEDHQAEHRQRRRVRPRAADEIVQDMIRNLPHAAAYTDSKGLFAPRKAVVHYTQEKGIAGVHVDDVYLGNGASELIAMSMNALLDSGDEVLLPSPDYPLYTAVVGLSGGTPVHYLCDEQSDWMPDIADIRRKITPRTKAIVVINPNNPTGAPLSRQPAARHRRSGAPARADRVRRRDLRQDALRRRVPHEHRLAGGRRAVRDLQRAVEELPLLRLPRGMDGGLRREAQRGRLRRGA